MPRREQQFARKGIHVDPDTGFAHGNKHNEHRSKNGRRGRMVRGDGERPAMGVRYFLERRGKKSFRLGEMQVKSPNRQRKNVGLFRNSAF